MNREEKNQQTRRRILDGALAEFAKQGYGGSSLNSICASQGISKGIIYHHFRDKDSLYLHCVEICFSVLTTALRQVTQAQSGTAEERLRAYFDARLRFFSENPVYSGIFMDASFRPPEHLRSRIVQLRQSFDDLNVSVLTALLQSETLRPGLSASQVAEDFRLYMDYFNIHFGMLCREAPSQEALLQVHEDRCHRQLDILLHGVLEPTER